MSVDTTPATMSDFLLEEIQKWTIDPSRNSEPSSTVGEIETYLAGIFSQDELSMIQSGLAGSIPSNRHQYTTIL